MAQVAGTSLLGLNAWDRHKRFIHDMMTYYGGKLPEVNHSLKSDHEVLRQSYRFIRDGEDDAEGGWEVQLAKLYYSRLFKEYAIADLSRYKEGKIGLRWRTEKEVVDGKGQFSCGGKTCDEKRGLASFEVPFSYREAGKAKQALVKVRVCPKHAARLNYRKLKEQRKAEKRAAKKRKRHAPDAHEDLVGEAENGDHPRKQRRQSDAEHGSRGPGGKPRHAKEAEGVVAPGGHHHRDSNSLGDRGRQQAEPGSREATAGRSPTRPERREARGDGPCVERGAKRHAAVSGDRDGGSSRLGRRDNVRAADSAVPRGSGHPADSEADAAVPEYGGREAQLSAEVDKFFADMFL
eukprot:jgi/Botrbrau1/12767/Bobra.0238s0006.1